VSVVCGLGLCVGGVCSVGVCSVGGVWVMWEACDGLDDGIV
jgi:hypothetical protein